MNITAAPQILHSSINFVSEFDSYRIIPKIALVSGAVTAVFLTLKIAEKWTDCQERRRRELRDKVHAFLCDNHLSILLSGTNEQFLTQQILDLNHDLPDSEVPLDADSLQQKGILESFIAAEDTRRINEFVSLSEKASGEHVDPFTVAITDNQIDKIPFLRRLGYKFPNAEQFTCALANLPDDQTRLEIFDLGCEPFRMKTRRAHNLRSTGRTGFQPALRAEQKNQEEMNVFFYGLLSQSCGYLSPCIIKRMLDYGLEIYPKSPLKEFLEEEYIFNPLHRFLTQMYLHASYTDNFFKQQRDILTLLLPYKYDLNFDIFKYVHSSILDDAFGRGENILFLDLFERDSLVNPSPELTDHIRFLREHGAKTYEELHPDATA